MLAALSAVGLLCASSTLHAERKEAAPKELEGVGIDEKLGAQLPLERVFTDSDGQPRTLGSVLEGDKPVILTLNYSNCPMLCNLQLDGFVGGLRGLDWSAGDEFRVVTISIDPKESTERAKATKEKYLKQYGRAGTEAGWTFLTGSEESIRAVANTVGFKYQYVEERQEYAHTAALVVLSPGGAVSRYLYGVLYEPRDMRMALVEASRGKVGSAVDRILLYCFHSDATAGRYAPVAANIMRLGGAFTVVLLAGVLGGFWMREAKKQRILSQDA